MRIARDVQTCEDLLNGLPVDEARLEPAGLAWALMLRFVHLDGAAIDEWFQQLREVTA